MERRLAAIFAADMVGFSRLMEADEMGTLTRQKRHRAELIDPKIAAHGGSIIKLTGDGMIAEFPSVVEAVQCAVTIQREMEAREADSPPERKIEYRIAVNLGDVIFDTEENDVYGDGVNIAARLEGLAPPGGVIVSGTAYDHLKTNIDVGYVDLGEQQVKNIATPIRAYQVVPEGETELARPAAQARRPMPIPKIIGAAAAFLIVAGVAVWQFVLAPGPIDAPLAKDAPILAIPTGPKILVLPYKNDSNDPEQGYFVDGLTEDLTTRLSQMNYYFVFGRDTAFHFRGSELSALDVAREIGADYVVTGNIRRSDESIRLSARLSSVEDGVQIWAENFDRELSSTSVFAMQDEMSVRISEAIAGSKGVITQAIRASVASTAPKDIKSYECVLLGTQYWNTYDPTVHSRALACAEESVVKDPSYPGGWHALASMLRAKYQNGLGGSLEDLNRAVDAIGESIRLEPDYAGRHTERAMLMNQLHRYEDARSSVAEAIRLAPTDPITLHTIANAAVYSAKWEAGWPVWQKVIQLDPHPPSWTYWTPLVYHQNAGDLEEAYRYALILKHETGDYFHWVAAMEASLLGQMGRLDEAATALSRVLEKKPDFAKTARDELSVWWGHSPDFMDRIMDGLYKAGLERPAVETQ
ncbi:MAG: adenylate/guanylate cyclase domain-containing protein [Pseudomonadota bacterium]